MSHTNGRRAPDAMANAMGQLGAAIDAMHGALGTGTDVNGASETLPDGAAHPPKPGPLAALNQRVEQLQTCVDLSREEARRRARNTLRLTILQWTFFATTLLVTNWDSIAPWVERSFASVVHGWGIEKFVRTEQLHNQTKKDLAAAEVDLARAHKELEAAPQDPAKQDAVADSIVRVRNLRREVETTQLTLDEYRSRYRK